MSIAAIIAAVAAAAGGLSALVKVLRPKPGPVVQPLPDPPKIDTTQS